MRGDWEDDEIETRVFFQPEAEYIPAQRVPVPRPIVPIEPPVRVAQGTAPTPTMIVSPSLTRPLIEDRFSVPSLATIAVRRQRNLTPVHMWLAGACACSASPSAA